MSQGYSSAASISAARGAILSSTSWRIDALNASCSSVKVKLSPSDMLRSYPHRHAHPATDEAG
jgi:hypothetical protein